MGFRAEGFLGADAQDRVAAQHVAYQELFTFANECSATAMKTALLPFQADNVGVSAGVMFARCIAQFQGAIILAERGLTIESMLLTRALYETSFVLGALAKKKVTPEELAASDFGNRKIIGNALLPIAGKAGLSDQHSKLKSFIAENEDAATISLWKLAKDAGMQEAYEGIYRHLSHFAAHPLITAASGYYVELPEDGRHVSFHPLVDETPKAVLAACGGITCACGAFEISAQTNSEINAEIRKQIDREDALYEKYRPF